MITLYQFKPGMGLPNLSPFCMKVENYLKMTQIPYQMEIISDPRKMPKGKGPVIKHEGELIPDSNFILSYLEARFKPGLDAHLDNRQKAVAHAFARMLEERFYWTVVYSRWVDQRGWDVIREHWFGRLPWPLKKIAPGLIQKKVIKDLHSHGIGRHSQEQIYQLAKEDLHSVAHQLGKQDYFMGEQASRVDAIVYAFMANCVDVPLETPIQELARGHSNIVDYCGRMKARYYS